MFVSKRQLIFIVFLFLCLVAAPLSAEEPEKADTRILIDISGSMKQNDPKNLRRSALRLLVGLMPRDNRAGVWTFAQYTNMLVPLGVINDSWKSKARRVSEKISSPGQFTNIEDVLKRSTSDWNDAADRYRRNIILLTDGMVDVSKDKQANAASRKRILEELAPKIKASGAQIHTIALSDRADHELMKQLSEMTGGWYEQVNSADELQRVFLRMFEKVGKPDSVPLQGNKFQLDSSIDEATLLVFTKDSEQPAKIMMPDGKVFDAGNLPGNISWHQDEGYNLITISKPQSGEWTIQAEMDPDNRVMVVTNLKMKSTDIPNRIALGEAIPVSVHFTEKGKLLNNKEFLDVVHVSAAQFFKGEEGEARPLQDDGIAPDEKAGDGRFSVTLGEGLDEGKVELLINADGKTFVRQRRQATQIVTPATLQVEDSLATTNAVFIVVMDDEVVDESSISVDAWVEDVSGQRTAVNFTETPDGALEAVLDKEQLVGRHFAVVNVSGKTLSGNDFSYQPQRVDIEGLAKPAPPPEPEPAPAAKPEPKPAAQPKPEPEPETEPEPEEETDWVMVGIVIGLGNLILIGLGVGLWLFMRKRSAQDEAMLFDEDEESGSKSSGEDEFDLEGEKPAKKAAGPDETIDISAEESK